MSKSEEVGPVGPCKEWKGAVTSAGYGKTTRNKKTISVHRLAWIEAFGPIPDGMFVLHHCDNKICMNPDHLFLGTQKDNMQDKMRKGRQAKGSRNGRAKLNEFQVRVIRMMHKDVPNTYIAKVFGVSNQMISRIRAGGAWRT